MKMGQDENGAAHIVGPMAKSLHLKCGMKSGVQYVPNGFFQNCLQLMLIEDEYGGIIDILPLKFFSLSYFSVKSNKKNIFLFLSHFSPSKQLK